MRDVSVKFFLVLDTFAHQKQAHVKAKLHIHLRFIKPVYKLTDKNGWSKNPVLGNNKHNQNVFNSVDSILFDWLNAPPDLFFNQPDAKLSVKYCF